MRERLSVSRQTVGIALALLCMCSLLGATVLVPSDVGPVDSSNDQQFGPGEQPPTQPPTLSTSSDVSGAESSDGSESDVSGAESSGGGGPEIQRYRGDTRYEIRLSEPITPGQPVTVTVLKNGGPVEGVIVTLNGDPVGRTDQFGQVSATVPFTEQLNVSAQRAAARQSAQRRVEGLKVRHTISSTYLLFDRRGVVAQQTDDSVPPVRRNESLSTTIEVTPLRDPRPGESVTFVAQIDGVPVSGATVRRNGTVVGQTDANGRIDVSLPWTRETRVSVRRGAANGSWTHSFAPLQLSVRAGGYVPVATGMPVSLDVTQAGRPVEGATVWIGSEQVGQTSPGGVTALRLPQTNQLTLTATRGKMTTSTTLTWLYAPYLVPIVVVLALASTPMLWLRRPKMSVSVRAGVCQFVRALLYGTIRAARRLATLLDASRQRIAALYAAFLDRDLRAALRALVPTTNPAVLVRRAVARIRQQLTRLVVGIRTLIASIRRTDDSTSDESAINSTDNADDGPGPPPEVTIREAFARVRRATPGETCTLTPGEIGGRATAQGLPADAVDTIVSAFRDVTYGTYDPTTMRESAKQAAERLSDTGTDGHASRADRTEQPQQSTDEGSGGTS